MSWYLPHRLTAVHYAVSIALLSTSSSVALMSQAHAASFGKMQISSTQHEPLAASIPVSDIESSDFAASLASPNVYQQMGLTPTDSMSVRFVPTSATSGRVVISTSQPVSKPFADVVLAIDDKGKRNIIPKTLLMPLGNDVAARPANPSVNSSAKPNLPVVSAPTSQPLQVKREAPPPLFDSSFDTSSSQNTNNQALAATSIQAPITTPTTIARTTPAPLSTTQTTTVTNTLTTRLKDKRSNIEVNTQTAASPSMDINTALGNRPINNSASNANSTNNAASSPSTELSVSNDLPPLIAAVPNETTSAQNNPNPTTINSNAVDSSALNSSDLANRILDSSILNIEVTRKIQTQEQASRNSLVANNTPAPIQSNSVDAIDNKGDTSNISAQQSAPPANNNLPAPTQATTSEQATPLPSYTVQRNDNLWIISEQIAKQNNVDVQSVMSEIKAQNPDAFINKDPNQLMKDVELRLPSYEVVPSQQSLQTAIEAQRQQYLQARAKPKSESKSKPKPVAPENKAATAQTPKRTDKPKPAVTVTQDLPQGRFSVIAPGRDGSADASQTEAAAATGNGLSTDVLATLKSSRQRTAKQVRSFIETNNKLNSYNQKLQLQNQKLAELEARLKELRNQ